MESTNEKTSKNESASLNKLLEELLSNIPKNSKLELIDFGPPVGRELPEFSKKDIKPGT